MTENAQWSRLYRYLDKRFAAIDERFDKVDQTFREHLALIEGLASRADHDDVERAAMVMQLDRHEVRISRLESGNAS